MTITLVSRESIGETATSKMFGGNILADRGDLTGDGSYRQAVDAMNVTDLRYPGGSLTEYNFDISDPDATTTIDGRTGASKDFIPLSEMMEFAENGGHAITIVVPTRTNLTENTDANGDRFANIDALELREFVHDVMTGVYGDADIAAFEIGNEYWGSGEMNATEYGRVASEMSQIIKSEMDQVSEVYDQDTSGTDVVFQMGHNYNYSNLRGEYEGMSGREVIDDLQARHPDADIDDRFIWAGGGIDFSGINNALVRAEFNEEEIEAADGIVAHVYSRGEDSPGSRRWDFRQLEKHWLDEPGFEDLKVYVTEWNQKSMRGLDRDEDYGLHHAHEMLNIVEEFMAYGIDTAHVWPLIQNTANPLASGMSFSEAGVPGEMFSMMAEALPGKKMIDFAVDSRETELETPEVDIHGFGGNDELMLYIASNARADTETTEVDITSLIESFGSIEITVLGVQDGELPGGHRADAKVEEVDPETVVEDGSIIATLAPGEIMQVILSDIVPTDAFAETWAAVNSNNMPDVAAPQDDIVGVIPPPPILPEETDDAGLTAQTPTENTDNTAGDQPAVPVLAGPLPVVSNASQFTGDDPALASLLSGEPALLEEPIEADDDGADATGEDGDGGGILGDMGWAIALLPFLALAGLAA